MSQHIRKTDFAAAVNGIFKVSGTGIELTLESVADGVAMREDFECFSLEFQGPKDEVLDQGTFELTHETLGTFALFMTPVEENERGRVYQAVFNRSWRVD